MTEPQDAVSQPQRAFTVKSLLFGLLGVAIVSGLAGFHDSQVASSGLFVGYHLPVVPSLFILLVALVWNGIWSRLLPALALSSRELTVVLAMTLIACFPPTSGLFRYFQRQLLLPWYYLGSGGKTEWEKLGLLNYLSPRLFPQPAPYLQNGVLQVDDTVYRGYFVGLAKGKSFAPLAALPWKAWVVPLMFWAPLITLMSLCVMGLSLLVHRQWTHHEQLSYPVAQVATTFTRRRRGKGIPDLFRSRLFWWGFSPVFALYAMEYFHQWFPSYVPGLASVLPNLKTWSMPLHVKWEMITKAPAWWALAWQSLYFSFVGLAYFVAAEVSLTMGLSTILLVAVGIVFFAVTGTPLGAQDMDNSRGGAYIAYALILLYTGRTYYWAVLKRAFGFRSAQAVDRAAVMAVWIALLSFAGFVGLLVAIGLDWLVALCFALLLFLMFLVFTRIICETGIPFMQTYWMPGSLLASLLGPAAVGPGPLVYILYLGSVLCQDPRECLMPFAATALRIADDAKIKLTRVFWILVGALLAALTIGFISTTWTQYSVGGMANDAYANNSVPTFLFDDAARQISELTETGRIGVSSQLHGLAKLRLAAPNGATLGYLLAGMGAVLLFSTLRFRFARFPLHPVLFLVWGTYPASLSWSSFLIGWAIKGLVIRFGGGKVYQSLKPLFVGLIAGELTAAGLAVSADMVVYWITGSAPRATFWVLPG